MPCASLGSRKCEHAVRVGTSTSIVKLKRVLIIDRSSSLEVRIALVHAYGYVQCHVLSLSIVGAE